jgi:riboflavin kinase / FMN adenylyltransferase
MIFDEMPQRTQTHVGRGISLSGSVLTIGSFDGVHRGHQSLLSHVVGNARCLGLASVVYTFDIPPKSFFTNVTPLTSVDEKVRRMFHFAPDHIIIAKFDAAYAARPALAFLEELARLNPEEVWVGEDFRFGCNRSGDVALLRRYFDVRIMPNVTCPEGTRISSTRLRALVAAGKNDEARQMHGWPDHVY